MDKKEVKKINYLRRNDLKTLANIRIENEASYNNLFNIFNIFVLHSSDLSIREGRKIISSFGENIKIRLNDINSKLIYFEMRGHPYFKQTGQNPYHYSNEKLIQILYISEVEQRLMKSIRNANKKNEFKKKINEAINKLNDENI